MYEVLDKDIIEFEIVKYIPKNKRGFEPRVSTLVIVNAILYKLKTGLQWYMLPVRSLIPDLDYSWNSVYYHFRKWSKMSVWEKIWIGLLKSRRIKMDLSHVNFDGSHTPCTKGGEKVSYQGRKKRKTTNSLYLTGKNGIPMAMSGPEAGRHHDTYDINTHFNEVISVLKDSEINVDGLFTNADSGFDCRQLRALCFQYGIIPNFARNKRNKTIDDDIYFDQQLYKERYSIERTNAWLDSFRSILNRHDTTVTSWKALNYIAFIMIGLRKSKKFK